MVSKSLTLVASVLGVAAAMPSQLAARQTPCGPATDLPYVAHVGYYSDENCNDFVAGICLYTEQGTVDAGSGAYTCHSADAPEDTPYYVKVIDSAFDALQILYTRDQSCPPSGPGAVFLTLVDNESCVQANLGGEAPGVSVFPNGGAEITRIAGNDTLSKRYLPGPFKRQNNAKCDGFSVDSEEPSQSQTVQVSNIIDCTNGGEQGCMITQEEQNSMSFTTSYSLSAGGGVEGVFSVEATFGMEFTEETTTGIQNGFSVDAGQRGYIGAYNGATLFTGRFTGCDSGDAEQAGTTLALRKNQIFYSIVLTGAS